MLILKKRGMNEWTNGGRGWGGCCSLLKSTVKTFDIYTEESEYIQAAKGGGRPLPCARYVWHCEDSGEYLLPVCLHQVSQCGRLNPDIRLFILEILLGWSWSTLKRGAGRAFPPTSRDETGADPVPPVCTLCTPCFNQQESLVQKAHVCSTPQKHSCVCLFLFLNNLL